MKKLSKLVPALVLLVLVFGSAPAAQAAPVPFEEDFDTVSTTFPALPDGWTSPGPGIIPAWEISRVFPHTAGNVAVGRPPVSGEELLITPILRVTSAASTLTFFQRTTLHDGFDGGVLEISTDGGPWQDILAAGASFAAGGYTDTIGSCCASAIAGRQAWSGLIVGPPPGYQQTIVNLPASLNGHKIQLRWRVVGDSDGSVAGSWGIDTISSTGIFYVAGFIEMRKSVVGGTGSETFSLLLDGMINLGGLNVPNGGTTGKLRAGEGSHTVGEQVDLALFSPFISCRDNGGTGPVLASGPGTPSPSGNARTLSGVVVADGSDIVCIITNVRIPSECQPDAPLNLIMGTEQRNVLQGTNGNDLIVGLGGPDVINAGAGNDCILAGDGRDVINAGDGNDKVQAGGGPDVINGGSGDDHLIGGEDRDVINGGPGNDICDEGLGAGCEGMP